MGDDESLLFSLTQEVETLRRRISQLEALLRQGREDYVKLRTAHGELGESIQQVGQELQKALAAQERAERRSTELAGELESARRDLERYTTLDPLTDLPNQRGLERLLASEVNRSQRSGSSLGALLVYIPELPEVVGQLGRGPADILVRELGRRLHAMLRVSDIIARCGHDLFLCILPDIAQVDLGAAARRVREGIGSSAVAIRARSLGEMTVVKEAIVPPQAVSVEDIFAVLNESLHSDLKLDLSSSM